MMRASQEVVLALACYAVAWLTCFAFVVGAQPNLVASYFIMGWSFSGLELPSFVWFGTWPLFFVLYATVRLLRWRRSRFRSRAA